MNKFIECLNDRARRLGIPKARLHILAKVSRTTAWRALKTNQFPARNETALKLAKALGWESTPSQDEIGPVVVEEVAHGD